MAGLEDQQIALKVNPQFVDASKPLLAASEYNMREAQTRNITAEAKRKEYDQFSEELGRAAKDILQQPEGPDRTERWNHHVKEFHQKGYIDDASARQWWNKPSQLVLNQAIARSTPVAQHAEMTGQSAGMRAAATSPYETREQSPTADIVRPALTPGAPPAAASTPGQFPSGPQRQFGGQSPFPALPQPRPAGALGAPVDITQGNRGAVGAPAPAPEAPIPFNDRDPIAASIPVLPAKTTSARPGVVSPAKTTPQQLQKDELASKQFDTGIREPGMRAAEQRSGLSTMRSQLEDGINTSKAAPALGTIAQWMYAAGAKPEQIRGYTGIDPTKSELFNKETIADSMKFVRETIGAREAFMAIQAVMQAFPRLENTKEANQAFIDIMDRAAQWKQDRANYSGVFQDKNSHIPVSDQLDGFNTWWNKEHSLTKAISERLPYAVPTKEGAPDTSKMENGVYYKMPDGSAFQYKINGR